ncbi:unnamed protein product [Auanema sp. JU1783]|nr:unnamed protein product [Auanema sp. JU1783]
MGRRKTKFRIKRMVTERRVPPRPQAQTQQHPIEEKEKELSAEDIANGTTSGFSGKAKIIRSSDGRMGMLLPDKTEQKPIDLKDLPANGCTNRRVKTKPKRIPPNTYDFTSDNLYEQINIFINRLAEVVNSLMKSYHDCGGQAYVYNQHIERDMAKEEKLDKRRCVSMSKKLSDLQLNEGGVPTPRENLRLPKEVLQSFQFEDLYAETKQQFFVKQVNTALVVRELSKAVKAWFLLDNKLGVVRVASWTNQSHIREDLCLFLEKVMLTQHISRIKSYLSDRKSDTQHYVYTRDISMELEHGEIIGDVYYPIYPKKPVQYNFLKKPRPMEPIIFDYFLNAEQKELAMNLRVQFVFFYRNMAAKHSGNVNFWAFVEHAIDHVLSLVGLDRYMRQEDEEFYFAKSVEILLRLQALSEADVMSDSRCMLVPTAREDILKLSSFIYQLTETEGFFPVLLHPLTFNPPVFSYYQNTPYLMTDCPDPEEVIRAKRQENDHGRLDRKLFDPSYSVDSLLIVEQTKPNPYARIRCENKTIFHMDLSEYSAYMLERQRLGLPMHWEIDLKVLFNAVSLFQIEKELQKLHIEPGYIEQVKRIYHLQQLQQMQMQFICSPTFYGSMHQEPDSIKPPVIPTPSYGDMMSECKF